MQTLNESDVWMTFHGLARLSSRTQGDGLAEEFVDLFRREALRHRDQTVRDVDMAENVIMFPVKR